MIRLRSRSIPGRSLLKSIPALLCAGIALWPLSGSAQTAHGPGGTLGIACEVPRRSESGKIILDWDGTGRIACEADRSTALHWEGLLKRLRGHVAGAIRKLEGETEGDALADFMDRLEQDEPVDLLTGEDGVLPGFNTLPDDLSGWEPFIGAAACGDWKKVHILVWLEVPRDRWTAAMAQRAINAWHARLTPRRAKYRTPWRLMDGELHRVDGYTRAPSTCFRTGTPPDWPDNWPASETNAWMAAMTAVSWTSDLETEFDACPDGKFGYIEKTRHRVGGVVGGVYVHINGENKGQPIRKEGGTLVTGDDDASWARVYQRCWDPGEGPGAVPDRKTVCTSKVTVPAGASDRDNTDCPVPDKLRKTCARRYPGYPRGKMIYRARKYSFPGDSGRDPVIGYHAENHCYDAELRTRQDVRNLPCPAGWAGLVKDTRNIRWWTFRRAPGSKARLWDNFTFDEAIGKLADSPSRNNPPAFGTVSAGGWVPDRSHCRRIHVPTETTSDPPRSPTCGWTCSQRGGQGGRNSDGEYCNHPKLPLCRRSGGNGNGGPDNEGHDSWDVDGDGRGDYASQEDAERAGHTGGRRTSDDCSNCGSSPGENDDGGDDDV